MESKTLENSLEEVVYIAYGSNLGGTGMKKRCPHAEKIDVGLLEGYSLEFRGGVQGYLTIKKNVTQEVPVTLWKVSKTDLLSLDRYEAYPRLYQRKIIEFEMNGKQYKGFVYIMNDEFKKVLPSPYYLELCKELYEENGFHFQLSLLEQAINEVFGY